MSNDQKTNPPLYTRRYVTDKQTFEDFIKWSFPGDIVENEKDEPLKEVEAELICLLGEISNIDKNNLIGYLENLPLDRRVPLFYLFRILTGTASINFKIFFSHWMVNNIENAKFEVIPNTRKKSSNPYTLRLEIYGEQITFSEKNFAILCDKKDIRQNIIDYFDDKGLISTLKIIKKDPQLGKKFLNTLLKYDQRGSDANKRGKDAENITRQKLVEMGFDPETDFNIKDLDVKKFLIKILDKELASGSIDNRVFNKKKKEIEKNKLKRKSDIILTLDEPSLFIQSSFYASDVASIADATINELNAEKELIKSATNGLSTKVKFIGLIDGPGWAYSISFSRLERAIVTVPDYFGLRTISTKLRKLLHDCDLTAPIDFEVGIIACKNMATKDEVIQKLNKLYKIPISKLKNELEKWIKRKKLIFDGTNVKLLSHREKLAIRYFILDMVFLNAKNAIEREIQVPGGISIDRKDVSKYVKQHNPSLVNEIDSVLTILATKSEIIRR